ncbi:MAG: glycosyltransferase [Proteobacteria bacterium]|nr:glycosyltransferase [Pseudomonadota bacterium]
MPSSKPTISVLVITYNHELYLKQALDSILSQRVDAELEIIVADDCSTDGTQAIAQEYQESFPDKIRFLATPKNLGHTKNYERAWKSAQGLFIAHCDGDDFWIDNEKLQKQLTFLRENPEFSFCSHKIKVLIGDQFIPDLIPRTEQSIFSTHDLLEACFPHNSSLFFRNGLFKDLPSFFHQLTGHDWCISILNSLSGPFKIFEEPMAVWRMRTNGMWGGRENLFHLKHTETFLNCMQSFLPADFSKSIQRNLIRNHFKLAEEYHKSGQLAEARSSFEKACNPMGFFSLPKRSFSSLALRLYFPNLYLGLKYLRDLALGTPSA